VKELNYTVQHQHEAKPNERVKRCNSGDDASSHERSGAKEPYKAEAYKNRRHKKEVELL
jgi:hypothetical protein